MRIPHNQQLGHTWRAIIMIHQFIENLFAWIIITLNDADSGKMPNRIL